MDLQRLTNIKSPLLLVGGAALTAIGVVSCAFATKKAIRVLEEHEQEIEESEHPTLNRVKLLVPIYSTTAGLTMFGVGLLLLDSNIKTKKLSAASMAYVGAERTLMALRESIEDNTTRPKRKKIEAEAANKMLTGTPPVVSEDQVLLFDASSGRYFAKTSVEEVKAAVNKLNETMLAENWVSLNDYYYLLGLPPVSLGNDLGWTSEKTGLIEIQLSATLTENDRPAVVVTFVTLPWVEF